MLTGYYKKTKQKKGSKRWILKGKKMFLRNRKTKRKNMIAFVKKISTKDEKQKLIEYIKKYSKMWKSKTALQIKNV